MNICLTANSSPWSNLRGGGNIAVHYLAEALSDKGHQVTVVYSKRPEEEIKIEVPYHIKWVRHFDVATVNLNLLSYGQALKKLIRSGTFDIVHGNGEEALLAPGLCRRAGIPFFYTSHANWLPPTGIAGGLTHPISFLKTVNSYLERRTADQADQIITFSEFSRRLVLKGLGNDAGNKVEVVFPGIDVSWFETVREPGPVPKIVLWGRMEDQKGIPELLCALQTVSESFPKVELILIGEGNRLQLYQKLAEDLRIRDRVTFSGWKSIDEIKQMISTAHLAVFPSRVESFGLAMAEAIGTGLPVIATRVGALPEFVRDKETGVLVDPGDKDALARAIIEALKNPEEYQKLAARGKEEIRQRFSWSKTADRLLVLYEAKTKG